MKKRHAFRPSLSDVLEDRVVLSHSHVASHVAGHAQIQPFRGADLNLIQSQINAAFANFALDYSQAQSAYLSPTAGTTPGTAAGLQNFVTNRISTLVQQVNGILGSVPGATTASIAAITAPLYGSGVGTLQQRLQSIAPVGTNGQTAATYAQQAADAIELGRNVTGQSFQILGNLANLNLYGQYQAQFNAGSHARLSRAQARELTLMNRANAQIQQTFSNFLNGLTGARNSVLFGTSGGTAAANAAAGNSIDLSSNYSTFNSQLTNGLIGLGNDLAVSLGGIRNAGNTFQPALVQALFGSGAGNTGLLGQFGNLQAPTDLTGLSAQQFNNATFNLVNGLYSNIQGRLNTFQSNPNFNFSTFTNIPSFGTGSSFFNSNGLFSPTSFGTTSNPTFFNGGFNDNSFNARNFGTGFGGSPTFAMGYGMNGFNTFFGQNSVGSGTSNFGNGFGGSFVNNNPNAGFGGGFFGGNSLNSTSGTNGGFFTGSASNPYTAYSGGYYGGTAPAATFSNGFGSSSPYTSPNHNANDSFYLK